MVIPVLTTYPFPVELFTVIQFWLDNKAVLPKLYTVARQVLCVPASSAASERVFSTAGRLLEKRRTNLSPGTVNSLLFLQSNME